MEQILLPSQIRFEEGQSSREATLIIEPRYYGYGRTIGNALRRVLLSSLSGSAVTAFKIKGVQHEFTSIPGVKEDALEVLLNLKALRVSHHSEGEAKIVLKKKGKGAVTAADFDANSEVDIINKDLVLCNLADDDSEIEMEVVINRGRGYSPTEEREPLGEIGLIAIDTLFSPVRNVGLKVENTRVGEITNYDKLIMPIETDGSITPKEAVQQSIAILLEHYNLISQHLA